MRGSSPLTPSPANPLPVTPLPATPVFRAVLLAALLAVLVVPTAASAQLSMKGGINLVELFGDDVASSSSRPRLAGGLGYDLLGFGPLRLTPEIFYAQKGADNFQSRLAAGEPVEVSLAYIEVPVLLRLALPFGGRRFQPYIAGGPVFGWQLNCEVRADVAGVDDDCGQLLGGQEQLEETLRNFEQGVMFGGGFAFEVLRGIGGVTVDARYARGLTRLSEGEDGPQIQNRALSVLLGYRFGLPGGGF
ncbi:porin family protein [soil metagenome]